MMKRLQSSELLIEQPPATMANQRSTVLASQASLERSTSGCSVTSSEREMIFLQGLPGSGKSTLAHERFDATHSFIDPDAIKANHPNYDPSNAAALHAWSKDEEEKHFMAATLAGGKWVIDGTGVNAEALVRRMTIAKSFGFTVKLVYVKVTLQTSIRRAAVRERVVPEGVIRDKARNIATSFEICSQYADEIEVVNNDSDR